MKCNQCQFDDTKVIESRDVADGQAIRRRRSCINVVIGSRLMSVWSDRS